MSAYLPKAVQDVIEQFERLPGIGPKSAARMAYHYLRSSNNDATALADALNKMDKQIVNCIKCFNVSEKEVCDICSNQLREGHKLCIVEEPLDVVAFEKLDIFNGLYFVLGGVISPADGVGAEELRFVDLKKRISELLGDIERSDNLVLEVIVATNPSLEGEATASYINEMIKPFISDKKIILTRLAMGLPTGADLEYADRLTLKRALDNRREV